MMIRTLTLSTLILFFSVVAAAQNLNDSLRDLPNVYYIKNSGKIVGTKDSADFVRVVIPADTPKSRLFTIKDYYLSGHLKMVGKSLTNNARYTGQGLFTAYFPNGNRKSSWTYVTGTQTNDWTWYYPNGKFYYTSTYDKEKDRTVVHDCRDSTGKVLAENGNGTWINYNPDFKFIEGRGAIKDGLKDGEWRGNANDSVTYVCTYSQGVSINGISYTKSGKQIHFTKDRVTPEYRDGMNNFYKFISQNVRYPKIAKKNEVQGKVFIRFVVTPDGKVAEVDVIKGFNPECDAEALRVVKMSPPWSPGYLYGIPVKVTYNVPIVFKLN